MPYNLADAKNRLTEVVNRALTEGRQEIHRRDDVVFVISRAELERIEGHRASFVDHLLQAPRLPGDDLAILDAALSDLRREEQPRDPLA